MPGMMAIAHRSAPLEPVEARYLTGEVYPGSVPDLTDPATLGCLLAIVREAYGQFRLVAIYCDPANGQSDGWAVQCAENRLPVAGEGYDFEAEALVAALEAAP